MTEQARVDDSISELMSYHLDKPEMRGFLSIKNEQFETVDKGKKILDALLGLRRLIEQLQNPTNKIKEEFDIELQEIAEKFENAPDEVQNQLYATFQTIKKFNVDKTNSGESL